MFWQPTRQHSAATTTAGTNEHCSMGPPFHPPIVSLQRCSGSNNSPGTAARCSPSATRVRLVLCCLPFRAWVVRLTELESRPMAGPLWYSSLHRRSAWPSSDIAAAGLIGGPKAAGLAGPVQPRFPCSVLVPSWSCLTAGVFLFCAQKLTGRKMQHFPPKL